MAPLTKHDAACRVIARLKKERDEARVLRSQAERQIPMSMAEQTADHAAPLRNGKRGAEDEEMGPDGKRIRPGISSIIISELADCNTALSQQSQKRKRCWKGLKWIPVSFLSKSIPRHAVYLLPGRLL